jgi:hypothetical protein
MDVESERTKRIAAACIAIVAWVGLVVQFLVVYRENASVLLSLWILCAFFTITTNLLVAAVFTAIAADRTALRADWVVAGTVLSILLVGVVYALLLHGLVELTGGSAVANVLLHMVTPVMVAMFWIFFACKGGLSWMHPLLWAIYPLAYLGYALVRGAATGKYAYPFLNVPALGGTQIVVNAVCIAAGFLLSGFAVVWIDHRADTRLG